MGRKLFIKVGDGPIKGPLDEEAVRASFTSGVLDEATLVGESDDALEPIAAVLAPSRPSPRSSAQPKKSRGKLVALAVAAVIVIGGVASGVTLYVRNLPPPLCKATPRILSKLDGDKQLTIKLYVTAPAPKKLDDTRRKVEGLLTRMRDEGHGKLAFKVIEMRTGTDEREAKEAGLIATRYADVVDTESAVDTVFFGLVFTYGAEQERIPWLAPDGDVQTTEFFIVNKMREISAKGDKRSSRIAIVGGHGGVAIGDTNLVPPQYGSSKGGPSVRGIINQYFPYYALDDVDLKKDDIAKEDVGVLVTQPDTAFDDGELAKIDEHVMRGGALAIIASAAHADLGDPQLKVKLRSRGLEKLTAGYGLELGTDVVYETGSRYELTVSTVGGSKKATFDWMPIVKDGAGLDTKSAVFLRFPDLVFPLASSITVHKDKQPDATFRVLATTTPKGLRDKRETVELGLLNPPPRQGEPGSYVLAAMVEGTLTSAFGKGKSAKPARVLLIASSAFLANPFVRAGTQPKAPSGMMGSPQSDDAAFQIAGPYVQNFGTNAILITKTIFDWLASEEDLGGCLPALVTKDEKKK